MAPGCKRTEELQPLQCVASSLCEGFVAFETAVMQHVASNDSADVRLRPDGCLLRSAAPVAAHTRSDADGDRVARSTQHEQPQIVTRRRPRLGGAISNAPPPDIRCSGGFSAPPMSASSSIVLDGAGRQREPQAPPVPLSPAPRHAIERPAAPVRARARAPVRARRRDDVRPRKIHESLAG